MLGAQQQLQPLGLPPHLQPQQQQQQQHHYYRRQQHYSTLPAPRRPAPCPEPLPRPPPCREPPPPPCPEPPPCREPPACPEPPRPLPCFEPAPFQRHDGGPALDRVRTYGPGCRRASASCSSRAASPLECPHGCQPLPPACETPPQVRPGPARRGGEAAGPGRAGAGAAAPRGPRASRSPPAAEPLSPFLRGGNFCPGNNVIYEKTIRKYELLNPHQVSWLFILPTAKGNLCLSVLTDHRSTVILIRQNNDQLDCRYFGELLAELNRKTNDLYSCLLQHVEKIGGRYWPYTEDIEDLIPKGLSEATKQQIRYLLQMRVTSDKSLRLVLSTFKNLREELCHLQDDLGKLETDNVLLKKDLAFKESQVKEYETMLTSLRENNRQQQQGLRESTAKCRSLEEQLLSLRLSEGEKDCQLKELEYCKRALEQEIQSLRLQICSNPTLQTTTDELSSRYVEMINNLREDKDREIPPNCFLTCQDISRREGNNSDLQIKLHELTSMLEEKDACIKQQQEDLFRLKHERLSNNQSPGVTAVITKKYRNQYPILGLLSDDYKVTSPVNKSQTIVIERTGEIWKHVSSP
uniref:POF1B actin binding protein n=1 Tax=Anser brachyrhynchus TaxID=132585 RepID=A0A8B9I627_9AVES